MRRVMGIAVFSGMLGVTFLGLLFTPLFYVLVRGVVDRRKKDFAPDPEGVQPLHAWRPPLTVGNEGSSHA
jgi:multidrug efflux pump